MNLVLIIKKILFEHFEIRESLNDCIYDFYHIKNVYYFTWVTAHEFNSQIVLLHYVYSKKNKT